MLKNIETVLGPDLLKVLVERHDVHEQVRQAYVIVRTRKGVPGAGLEC